ncbi:MAG: hypothetical protein V4450_01880 [Bacteroidota bacterium]
MKKVFWIILVISFSVPITLLAQGYQALHGSAYTGSTAVFNNPAASVNAAYKWDLTLFSTQFKISNSSAYLKNFSLANQDSSELTLREGTSSKFLHANFDVSLLNFLYKIDSKHAVNFGIRARSYIHVKTLPFNFVDTLSSFNSFLIANRTMPFLQGFGTQTGWLEADLNYSQVLFENSNSKLSGGITLQIMKGMSGAFVKLNKISYLEGKTPTDTFYTFTNGSGAMGYSANYDQGSFKDFLKNSLSSFGLSLGVEYMTYNSEDNAASGNNNLNYDWKIGVSLMDLGANKFKPSINSMQFYDPVSTIPSGSIETKFTGAANISDLKDSIKTLFNNTAAITDNFSISNPTRLILNVDKNLGNNFYINGEMSMNFYSTSSFTKLRTRELNLLTITPRWETIGLGAYLPMQYNTQGQLWVGAAIKAGPLVLGIHNLGIFKKDPSINGGAYLLLSVHPFNKKRVLGTMDCPD